MAGKTPYQKIQKNFKHITQEQLNMDNHVLNNQIISNEPPPPVTLQPTMVTVNNTNTEPINTPIIPLPVGPNSALITCHHCRCRIHTKISHRATTKTHMACMLLSWTCCCCLLPYCIDSCQNTDHYCPMCNGYLGTYSS